MPEPFSFLHTGDLHLDTPFAGLTSAAPPAVSGSLRSATLRSWDRIVALALERRVDFVVVAGDVFESETRTLLGQLAFADGLDRLSARGTPTAVVTGNHDPLSGWEATVEWPALAHRFGAGEVGRLPIMKDGREIARVYGISYATRAETRDLAALFHRDRGAPFSVGLLHATIGLTDRHERYAPTTDEVLLASRMDYWALGHIHARRIVRPGKPCIVYPGNPQGRDPGETEPCGVAIVTVDADGVPHPEFVDTDVVRWVIARLDCAPIASMNVLRDTIRALLEEHAAKAGRSIVARVELIAFTQLHGELQRPAVREDLLRAIREAFPVDAEPFVWLESLRDETRSIEATAYARGADFVSELDALVEVTKRSLVGDGAVARVDDHAPLDLASPAAELLADARIRRAIGDDVGPDSATLAVALDEARTLVLDRLRSTGS